MKSKLKSMTAFASAQGAFDGYAWSWELRSVNGKGLDLRLRVPDWLPGLEQRLKEKLGRGVVKRDFTCATHSCGCAGHAGRDGCQRL